MIPNICFGKSCAVYNMLSPFGMCLLQSLAVDFVCQFVIFYDLTNFLCRSPEFSVVFTKSPGLPQSMQLKLAKEAQQVCWTRVPP